MPEWLSEVRMSIFAGESPQPPRLASLGPGDGNRLRNHHHTKARAKRAPGGGGEGGREEGGKGDLPGFPPYTR
jgi:hypothetical protein